MPRKKTFNGVKLHKFNYQNTFVYIIEGTYKYKKILYKN